MTFANLIRGWLRRHFFRHFSRGKQLLSLFTCMHVLWALDKLQGNKQFHIQEEHPVSIATTMIVENLHPNIVRSYIRLS